MKITGLFGSLQVVNIACSLVRAKLIALWIGAAGVGLFGIFNSAMEMIFALTQLGIRQSAVQAMASAKGEAVWRMATAVRRCGVWLGVAGSVLTLVCCRWLSELSFGNPDYWWGFAWLSTTVLLSALNAAEGAVFQGLRRFKKLATCSMLGAVGGLAVSIPMFYFWGIKSVIPSILAYFVMTWLALGYYRERTPKTPLGASETVSLARQFLKLGFYLTVTTVVTNAVSYAFAAWLNRSAGIDAVGYYNAGFTLVNRYAGLVFTAIAMEYFPRLTAVAKSQRGVSVFVSNQISLSLGVLCPIATLFIAGAPWVIELLYDGSFMVALPLVTLAMTGTVFRAVSWCMAFVMLARNDGRTFLLTEIASSAVSITLNIVFYRLWGFTGLGVAYVLWYFIYCVIIATVYKMKYRLRLNPATSRFVAYSVAITALASVVATLYSNFAAFAPAFISVAVSLKFLSMKLKLKRN